MNICVNMKELACWGDYLTVTLPIHMLSSSSFGPRLTTSDNGYFFQLDVEFIAFLQDIGSPSRPNLESLELHSNKIDVRMLESQLLLHSLGCHPHFFSSQAQATGSRSYSLTSQYHRNIHDLVYKPYTNSELGDALRRVLKKNINRTMKSLALFLKQ